MGITGMNTHTRKISLYNHKGLSSSLRFNGLASLVVGEAADPTASQTLTTILRMMSMTCPLTTIITTIQVQVLGLKMLQFLLPLSRGLTIFHKYSLAPF